MLRQLILSAVAAVPFAQTPAPSRAAAWRADVDSLVARIVRIHPQPWAHRSRAAFQRDAAVLRGSIGQRSDGELLAGVMRLAASLEDGHTAVTDLGPAGGKWFPVRIHLFADGLWVTAIAPEHAALAGARILRIGGVSAADATARILALISADNEFGRRQGAALLSNAVLLRGLGITSAEDRLDLEVEKGGTRSRMTLAAVQTNKGDISWWQYGEMYSPAGLTMVTAFGGRAAEGYMNPAKNSELPLHLRGRRAYWWTALPERRTVYLQVNSVSRRSSYSPLTLEQTINAALAHVDSAPAATDRFILDLRYNSGGDGSVIPRLVNAFVKRDSSISRRGRLFVIVGGKTFSAAAGLTVELMRHLPVILVGEPMGVPLNSSGDAGHSVLPGHHIDVIISTRYSQGGASDDRIVPVQLPAIMTGELYFAGKDPAVETILSSPAPLPEVVTTLQQSGGLAARALWNELKSRYGAIPWWQPFTRDELNDLGLGLLGQKRTEDAIVGLELNTERYPGAWETWDSLGDGYKEAGRKADARAAYERALKIAPDNWNAAYQHKMIRDLGGSP